MYVFVSLYVCMHVSMYARVGKSMGDFLGVLFEKNNSKDSHR